MIRLCGSHEPRGVARLAQVAGWKFLEADDLDQGPLPSGVVASTGVSHGADRCSHIQNEMDHMVLVDGLAWGFECS